MISSMSWAHGSRPKYKAHRGLPSLSLSLSLLGPSRPNASACAPTPRTGLRKSADGGGGRAATAALRSSPLMGGRPCRMLQCSARRTGIQGVPSSAQSPGRRSPVTRRDARACAGGIGGDARAGRKKGDAHLRGGAGGMGRALVREEKLWRTTRVTARARRLFERMPEPRCASEVTLPWFPPCVLYHMLQIKSSSWCVCCLFSIRILLCI